MVHQINHFRPPTRSTQQRLHFLCAGLLLFRTGSPTRSVGLRARKTIPMRTLTRTFQKQLGSCSRRWTTCLKLTVLVLKHDPPPLTTSLPCCHLGDIREQSKPAAPGWRAGLTACSLMLGNTFLLPAVLSTENAHLPYCVLLGLTTMFCFIKVGQPTCLCLLHRQMS